MRHLLFFLGLGVSTLASAASDYDKVDNAEKAMRAMESREQEVKARLSNLNRISTQVSRLNALREKILLGDNGLKFRTDSWVIRANSWMTKWQNLVDLVVKTDAARKDGFATDMQNRLSELSVQFDELVQSSQGLASQFSKHRQELDQLPAMPQGLVKSREANLQAFNASQDELRSVLKNAETQLSTGFSAFSTSFNAVANTLDAYLRTQLTKFPELQVAIKNARETLQVSTSYESKIVAIETQSLRVKDLTAQYAFQSAKKELAALKTQIMTLSRDLQQKFPGNGVAKNFLNRMTAAQGKAEDTLQSMIATIGEGPAFVRHMKMRRQLLTIDCKKPEMQPLRDCELLRTLNALNISPSTLTDYTPADMEYLEKQLRLVAQGPSYVRTSR